ncbi:hypothetical protein [Streptococcus gallolyticus]|uniref:hypothetical protein n=1 Tax=Streptococcus gallolyticus TaxID=315405 RepID=UPI001E4C6264|nr:hypothetical protein [Streptococcus gallolyticus]
MQHSYLSGIYFYKLVNYFTSSQRVAVAFSGIFYLLNIALGFGGLYPIQFAMPFVIGIFVVPNKIFCGYYQRRSLYPLWICWRSSNAFRATYFGVLGNFFPNYYRL